MRKSFLAAATLGVAVLSASAFGQVVHTPVDATPYSITIKGSLYWPIDSNLRSVDKLFAGGGLEYLFPTQLIRGGSETYAEIDAFVHTTASSNLTIIPLTINQRFYGGPGSSLFGHNGRSFFFLGGGVSWFDPKGQAKLTAHGGVGTELGSKIFAEAALYIAEQDKNGFRNSGVTVSLGYRF